ncbi:nucleoside-diphosphate-sugar epimerase [Colletotrichum tofieldiae]|nr:nucleoside-diphosphate-sugar epimerase [Colletotrichum tofieldiae]
MAPKLFITGVTGYIGGASEVPKREDRAGSLDDSDIIRRAAAWADIVLHTADSSDHENSAKAIAAGLAEGHFTSRTGYSLHVGGTGILTYLDSEVKKTFGEPDVKVFNDLEGVDELVNLPDAAFHCNIDNIVLETGTKYADRVKTAIICPPSMYGTGRGPVSGRGRQVYELTSFIIKQKFCPRIGRGLARWNNVHVYDLSNIIGLLTEAALDASGSRGDESEIWGPRGYFLTENGEHTWGELAVQIGREVLKQGLADGDLEAKEWSMDEALKSPAGFDAASWGMNSRAKALRAKKVLGWQPAQHGLVDEIPSIVKSEAARLG